MGEKTTFIKLDRSILNWRWYKDGNTLRVFLHLLITANVVPHGFEHITVERGSVVSSYEKISHTLNLTEHQVRTAITHLKSTGTITSRVYRRFQVFTIVNYDYYQGNTTPSATPSTHHERTLNTPYTQQYNNIKNEKNEKNIYTRSNEKKQPQKTSGYDFLEGVCEL